MVYLTFPCAVLGACFALLLQLAPAEAQQDLFVATTGSDANNCSSTLPLRVAYTVATPAKKESSSAEAALK